MATSGSLIIPVQDLSEEPYRALVAYPSASPENVALRVNQLVELGIAGLEFQGPLRIGRLSILGKGVVGLVFAGVSDGERVAVKIRRVDSRRHCMRHEADMLRAANNAGIGPRCLGASQDVLKMKFFEGERLPSWISSLRGRGTRDRVRSTLKSLLEQCARLDAHGLDHGELSRAHKNVLVSAYGLPCILDFESASLMRRANNFTSIAQYLFLSKRLGSRVERMLGPVDRVELVQYLRLYKSGMTNDAFDAVRKMFRLPN